MLLTLLILQLLTVAGLAYCFVLLRRTMERQAEADAERTAAASLEDLLQEVQASAEQSIQDLARQKSALQKLLREADKRIQLIPDDHANPALSVSAIKASRRRPARRIESAGTTWQEEALQLARDGMSAAAIARQVKAGVEEVQLVLSRARLERERALPPTA